MHGLSFPLELEIIDNRRSPQALVAATEFGKGAKPEFSNPNSPYQVKAMLTVSIACLGNVMSFYAG
jgi:hypothetical protein